MFENTVGTPEQRFAHYAKTREKHLGVFRKAAERLAAVEADMEAEIASAKKAIEEHHAGIAFLDLERQKAAKTRSKIADLLGE